MREEKIAKMYKKFALAKVIKKAIKTYPGAKKYIKEYCDEMAGLFQKLLFDDRDFTDDILDELLKTPWYKRRIWTNNESIVSALCITTWNLYAGNLIDFEDEDNLT